MRRARVTLIITAAVAGLWCTGCGSQSTGPDIGQPAELGGQDVGVKPEGWIKPESGIKPEGGIRPEGGAANTVEVTYGGNSVKVDLTKPQPVPVGGVSCARLSDVALLAFPGKDLATLTADFASSDGFMPGQQANCKGLVPIAGDKLAKGYVQLQGHRVVWDSELGLPGCLSVKDLAKLILADK